MQSPVWITGVGIISALGKGKEESLQQLTSGYSTIGRPKFINTRHAETLSVGEVFADHDQLLKWALIHDEALYTRTSLLGIIAAREAMHHAGIKIEPGVRTGLVSATSVGGMGVAENHYLKFLDSDSDDKYLPYIKTLDCSDSTERIADALGIKDFITTISTACSSSANAIMYGARLIRHGLLDRVIAGGTDSLSRFTINGFSSLQILDPDPCKPFDRDRRGLNLGEGAGYVVLESTKALQQRSALARLAGYANFNDAYHQTSSSPEGTGALQAMMKALQVARCPVEDVSYINAHGTGTEINDQSEGMAIRKLFYEHLPPVSSTKGFTGHTLAAAGGIEAVISVLAIQNGLILPNLNFTNPIPDLEIHPVTKLKTGQILEWVLSNSFGFGGNTTSLVIQRA